MRSLPAFTALDWPCKYYKRRYSQNFIERESYASTWCLRSAPAMLPAYAAKANNHHHRSGQVGDRADAVAAQGGLHDRGDRYRSAILISHASRVVGAKRPIAVAYDCSRNLVRGRGLVVCARWGNS